MVTLPASSKAPVQLDYFIRAHVGDRERFLGTQAQPQSETLVVPPIYPTEFLDHVQSWHSSFCSDFERDSLPSEESNELLVDLERGGAESGEPALLAWHALISACTGNRDLAGAKARLFKTLVGGTYPALTARLDTELALRNGDCKAASRAAYRLAEQQNSAEEARLILLARTACEAGCKPALRASERLESLGGDLAPFAEYFDACRSQFARKAELEPQLKAASDEHSLARKQAVPAQVLGPVGLVLGGALVVGSGFARSKAIAIDQAASLAETGPEYLEQAGLLEEANSQFGALAGSGTALITSGIVGAIIAGVQAKKRRSLRDRHASMRAELDELEGSIGR